LLSTTKSKRTIVLVTSTALFVTTMKTTEKFIPVWNKKLKYRACIKTLRTLSARRRA